MAEQSNTWTPARINMLQELWGSGLSAKEIAGRLGENITRNAVIGKAHRLGLSSRPSPIKKVDGKPVGGMIKTRSSAPKSMGLRRDVMVGNGSYAGSAVRAYKDETEVRRTRAEGAPRVFKPSQSSATQTQTQQCRWPLGDPLKAGFRFCEHSAIPGLSYCYDHACVAYQGSKKKIPAAPREENVVAADAVVAEAAVH